VHLYCFGTVFVVYNALFIIMYIARNKAILINGYEARNYTYFVVLQQLRKSRTFAAYILHIV